MLAVLALRRRLVALTLMVALALSFAALTSFMAPSVALADSAQLTGKVTDSSGNGLSSVTVAALDTTSGAIVASTGTGSDGSYTLSIASGTYNIQVTPPTGSSFGPSITKNETISGTTTLNFILVPAGSVTLTGHVYGVGGAALSGAEVRLLPAGRSEIDTWTDANGAYSFTVAPGSYLVAVQGCASSSAQFAIVPGCYNLGMDSDLTLTQSQSLDIQLPFKQVTVHVQDPDGSAVAGVALTGGGQDEYHLTLGTFAADGESYYSTNPTLTTDANGNAIMWLYPTTSYSYTITATPPTGSPFVTFSIPNLTFSTDITENVVLQFVHDPPQTTAQTSPQPVQAGIYPGPVTVTLSATATSGFTVANTYYTVDGGAQQTYSQPFTVSGEGNHTVTYWSVDNAGVYEFAKTLSFQIESLKITTSQELPSGTVGVPYSVTLQASGGTQPYTWSVSSGALPPGLNLNSSTGEISGTPTTAGTFGFTIKVTDSSQVTATQSFSFVPPPPTGSAGSGYNVPVTINTDSSGNAVTCNSYSVQSGSLPPGVTLDPTTGELTGTPTNGGTYNVTIACETTTNESVEQTFTITINNPAPVLNSISPNSATEGDGPLTVTVTGTGFVQSSTVQWNGSDRPTTYVSASELTVAIPASDLADTGTAAIQVTNPAPVGGTTGTLTFTIANMTPKIGHISGPASPVSVSSTAGVSASISDAPSDTDTATWDWGDGSSSPGIVSETNGSGTVSGSHAYAAAGIYSVTLTVSDEDGASAKASYSYVVVYDASAGFVTGGGWFNSPAGADTANPSQTGKANFGFNAKYHKGSSTPDGELQFQSGELNFHSTSLDDGSLVISGGFASFSGTGTVNGSGSYDFWVEAYDCSAASTCSTGSDGFRIRITDPSNGNAVVYDNLPGGSETLDASNVMAIAHGNIVIHK